MCLDFVHANLLGGKTIKSRQVVFDVNPGDLFWEEHMAGLKLTGGAHVNVFGSIQAADQEEDSTRSLKRE